MDADLRRQLGVGDERDQGRSASASRSSIGGHRGDDVRGRQVAEGRYRACLASTPSLRGDDGLRCVGAPHRRRAESRQPQAGTRRDRPVRRAGRHREGPAAGRRLPADRRQRAAPRRHLGAKLRELGADCPAAGRAADARPVHHPRRPASSGRRPWPSWSRRSRATRRQPYEAQGASPEVAAIAADEREHAVIWDRLEDAGRDDGRRRSRWRSRGRSRRRARIAARGPTRSAPPSVGRARVAWHRASAGASGTLRAVIFGVSDGLVSNLSLVMGVAGAAVGQPEFHPARRDRRPARRARSAWPPASTSRCRASASCSSARSRSNGPRWRRCPRRRRPSWPPRTAPRASPPDEAATIAHRIFQDPETALDMLVREELGLDPDELGSPWGAAGGSFVAFAIGAVDPGHPVPVRRRPGGPLRQPRSQPRRAVRGRRRGQPAHRPRADLLGRSASSGSAWQPRS